MKKLIVGLAGAVLLLGLAGALSSQLNFCDAADAKTCPPGKVACWKQGKKNISCCKP